MSIRDVINDPSKAENWVAVGLDVVGMVTPVACGLGTAYKAATKVDDAVDAVKALNNGAETLSDTKKITEGIYEVSTVKGKQYVGQSKDIDRRLTEHVRDGKISQEAADQAKRTEVSGGKTQRELAEQRRLDELGGANTQSNPNPNVENRQNPVSEKRQKKLRDQGNQ